MGDVIRTDHGSRRRLQVESREQGVGKVAGLVGNHTPADTPLIQLCQQVRDAGKRPGKTTQEPLVNLQQAQAGGFKFRVALAMPQGKGHQCPGTMGYL